MERTRRSYKSVWILISAVLVALPTEGFAATYPTPINPINNYSFENAGSGQQPFDQWTASSTTAITRATTEGALHNLSPYDRSYFALLKTSSNGSFTLTSSPFAVGLGAPLNFRYFLDADTSGQGARGTVQAQILTWNGSSYAETGHYLLNLSFNSSSSPSGLVTAWTALPTDYHFDGSDLSWGTYELEFKLTRAGGNKTAYLGVDYVVPLPATVILGMLGLGTAGLGLRKFA